MSTLAQPARVDAPVTKPERRRPRAASKRRRIDRGVLWIAGLAVLLAGVVAVNVAVLQLNVRLDELGREACRAPRPDQAPARRAVDRLCERADRQPRARRAGARRRRLVDHGLRGAARAAVSEQVANRRIRLLLLVAVLVFAGTLGRAVWLQGVQAGTLERMATKQQVETIDVAAPRGTISTEPASRWRSASRRRPSTPTRAGSGTRGGSRRSSATISASTRTTCTPRSPTGRAGFVYVQRKADPEKATSLAAARARRPRLLSRGAADVSAGLGRGARARLRRRRQRRARRARAVARLDARRALRQRDRDQGSVRTRDRRAHRAARATRARRHV